MKAQFKYAFRAGLNIRLPVFAVIFTMDTVFIILGSLGLLPFAALVTAVSLGGVAIAAMLAVNVIADVFIARRMFLAPEAYLHALTPVPRRKILLASVIAITVLDLITMTFVISAEVWLSFNLAGGGYWHMVWEFLKNNSQDLVYLLWCVLLLVAGYMLMITIIMFCVTAKKSIFFKKPASGFLAFLLGCGCVYAISLLQLVLAPFSGIERYGLLIVLNIERGAVFPVYVLLTLIEAAVLFVLTSKLMERKINI